MLTRLSWYLVAAILMAGVLAGCSGQQTTTPGDGGGAAKTSPDAQVKAPESIPQGQASPAPKTAVSPAPATGASPTGGSATPRGEPKGRVVYGWHTALSPAWLDPQENQAVITPYAFQ